MDKKHFFWGGLLFFLTACEQLEAQLGLETLEQKNARLEAEGKAVGNGCRHAGRAIEDCYAVYSWLPKAGIFEGWLAMDKYMREHNLEAVVPILPPPDPPNKKRKKKKTAEETEESTPSS